MLSGSASLQFALQPVIDLEQVRADIVEAGAPRVRLGPVTRPLLVRLAVDGQCRRAGGSSCRSSSASAGRKYTMSIWSSG